MCSAYWNLNADIVCPNGHALKQVDLQTHFEGEIGSCMNWYQLGAPVAELAHVKDGWLSDFGDEFITRCDQCIDNGTRYFEMDGRIENGAIVELRPKTSV